MHLVHASEPVHLRRVVPGSDRRGALEEEVFEKMRDPRRAEVLIGATDGVLSHERHGWGTVLREHQKTHSVVQRYLANGELVTPGCLRRHLGTAREQRADQKAPETPRYELHQGSHGFWLGRATARRGWQAGHRNAERLPKTTRWTMEPHLTQGDPSWP